LDCFEFFSIEFILVLKNLVFLQDHSLVSSAC